MNGRLDGFALVDPKARPPKDEKPERMAAYHPESGRFHVYFPALHLIAGWEYVVAHANRQTGQVALVRATNRDGLSRKVTRVGTTTSFSHAAAARAAGWPKDRTTNLVAVPRGEGIVILSPIDAAP